MQIKNVPIKDIIEYSKNNRVHSDQQIDRIACSITDFGFNQPLVVDETNTILVGHGRLLAARKLNLKEVPVYKIGGLTPAQKKAYRILDNKLQNDSTWNIENLPLELQELRELGFDFERFGLEELEAGIEDDPEIEQDEFESAEGLQTNIKRGDLIELGPHRLLCGDSLSKTDVARLCDGQKFHVCLTDPPYSVNYDKSHLERGGNKQVHGAYHEADLDPSDLLKFIDLIPCDLFVMSYAVQKHMRPMLDAFDRNKFEIRKELVWVKNICSFWMGAAFQQKHEPIWIMTRKNASFADNVPADATTVFEVDKPRAHELHPTEKPLQLWAPLLGYLSAKGDRVYEPFNGSGTTMMAAEQLGRICHSMEIEPQYCQVAVDRYIKYCEGKNRKALVKINGEPYASEV